MSDDELPEIPLDRRVWPLLVAYAALAVATFGWTSTNATVAMVAAVALAAVVLVDLLFRLSRVTGAVAIPALVLLALPACGLVFSHLERAECRVSGCELDDTLFRPLAEPEVYGLVVVHLLTVLAYAISRRRRDTLRPATEALVHAALFAGIVVHAVVAVHIARFLPAAALFPPVFLPCAAPLLTVVLYGTELHARLRRRGTEAAARLAGALALTPVLLGAHAVVHALWLGRADGAFAVVTRTCGHVLSAIPIEELPCHGHYLCTVAARGHSWLVKPERLGRRGGVPVVVNRQLALANAFEDLIHERWPRTGRLARRAYDRVGLPVSRYLRRPLLADLVYLAMKPAEWGFYAVLLLLDRGDPEARIDRMYR